MLIARPPAYPGVAQFGSALEWGSRGREFDSRHSDQIAGLEIGRTPLNVTIERCFLCLCHFCAAACLGGFWHKVTDQCADWPRCSGRGQPHPPCKSTGCRALLRPGAGEPPAAPHPPAPVCGGADAKTKPAVHGGTGKKGDRPGVGAPERSGSCGRNPQIPHSYFTLCRRILQLFRVWKLLWGAGCFCPPAFLRGQPAGKGRTPACPPVRGIFCCLTGAGVLQ